MAYREAGRRGLDTDAFLDLTVAALLGGLVGARVLSVLLAGGYYLAHPGEVLRFDHGGLSLYGALLGGAAAAYLVARWRRLPFLKATDAVALGVPLAYAIGRVGCDVYGKVTTVPWAVWVDGLPHHPSQAYSSILGFGIFGFLWFRRKKTSFDGEILAWYVGLYAVGRFLIEFTRYGQMVGPLTLTQVVTIPAGLAAFWALWRHGLGRKPVPDALVAPAREPGPYRPG